MEPAQVNEVGRRRPPIGYSVGSLEVYQLMGTRVFGLRTMRASGMNSAPMISPALGIVVCIVFCFAIGFCVFGLLVARLFRWRWLLRQGPGLIAVFGLSASILFFEVWNFFYSVDRLSVGVLGSLALILAIVFRLTLWEIVRSWLRNRSVLGIVLLLALLLTVSLFALYPAESGHFDTGLYYLNAIRWAHEYPVVPGLGNLHTRLGYNQSLFLFISFLSSWPHMGMARACQIVNPLFVFVSGWAILDRFRVNLTSAKAKRVRLYGILLLCPISFLGTQTVISAPTSDIAAAAFALPGALAFVCCLEVMAERNAFQVSNWLLLLVICGCTIAKLKLSYAVFGGFAVASAALGLIFIRPREFVWSWIRTGAIAAVFILPWLARGVVLTGYPFYPATFIRFHTDWAVARDVADNDRNWIYSWARMRGLNRPPSTVLANYDWIGPWLTRNLNDPENNFLLFFLVPGVGFALFSLLVPSRREHRLLTLLLVAQTSVAILFWFQTAPDPRFAYATLLLFAVNGFYAFTCALFAISDARSTAFTCLIATVVVLLNFEREYPLIYHAAKKFPQGFPKAQLEYKVTDSGLRVGVPKDQLSWATDLVVTPDFNSDLSLRGRDLRDGFRVRSAHSSAKN
jgi:hypothetical protein